MKYYFLAAMLLVCAGSFAQQPVLTDDLNTGTDTIIKKHIRFDANGGMANSNYAIVPAQFYEKINQARKDAYRQIESGGPEDALLKRLNTDYYLRNGLWKYRLFGQYQTKTNGEKGMTDAQQKYAETLIYSNSDPNNEVLFKRSAAYREWLNEYLENLYQTKYRSDITYLLIPILQSVGEVVPTSVVLGEIQNAFIRDYECYQNANMGLSQKRWNLALDKKIYQDFNAAVKNTYYREEIQQIYDNYKRMHTAGAPAPDFTYTAVDGKPVTLSSLRGKYVYIDVWATWCGPCTREIPSLMKLEDKYEGKNIQFVSISINEQASAGMWRKYVTDNKLTGYQVMADIKSDFCEKFDIAAIPRFILIDPAGKTVDADAKRPSDSGLKRQLDQLLGIPAAPFALSPYARKTDFSGRWRLNKSKTKLEGVVKNNFFSSALNVTKNGAALVVERTDVNNTTKEKESYYSEQFKLRGTPTQTTMDNRFPEADSLENNPEIPGLTLGRCIKVLPPFSINITETWTLEDGGKTLVVDWADHSDIAGDFTVKLYYNKQ